MKSLHHLQLLLLIVLCGLAVLAMAFDKADRGPQNSDDDDDDDIIVRDVDWHSDSDSDSESETNDDEERIYNIVVLGNAGVGKSSLLNMFAGDENAFEVGETARSVTQVASSKVYRFMNESDGLLVRLIDTQGLADSAGEREDLKNIKSMVQYIRTLGYIDLFLVCFDGLNPYFTSYSRSAVELFSAIFPDFLAHSAIVFNKWSMSLERTNSLRNQYQNIFRTDYNLTFLVPCYFIDSNFNRKMLRDNADGTRALRYLHPTFQERTRSQVNGLRNFLYVKEKPCDVRGARIVNATLKERYDAEVDEMREKLEADKREMQRRLLLEEQTRQDELYSNDLLYFNEANMDQSIFKFYRSLPAHLQAHFRRVYPEKVDESGRTLQEQVTTTSNGLTKVAFWFAVSHNYHFIPVFGSIYVGIVRAGEDTDWKNMYFDAQKGRCFGPDLAEAAAGLNRRGEEFYKVDDCAKALEYYENAYENSKNVSLAETISTGVEPSIGNCWGGRGKDPNRKDKLGIRLEAKDVNGSLYVSNVAKALNCLNRYAEALEKTDEALELNKNNVNAQEQKRIAEAKMTSRRGR